MAVNSMSTPYAPGRPPQNFKTLVMERVRQDIFEGRLKPGQKIDQDQLAEELGISKLPVREALILLENEGLVVNPPRRGCRVADLTRQDIKDHYELIGLVTGAAARRAATVLSDSQLVQLRTTLDLLDEATAPAQQEQLNHEFHRIINTAGSSRRLRSAVQLFTKTMPRHFFDFAEGWTPSAKEAHEEILRCLERRDPNGSEQAMRRHMEWGAEVAVENLERIGFWD